MGGFRQPGGAEGGRARNAKARLGLRAACLARPVAVAGRLPQEPARRAGDPGDHSVLEYREGLALRRSSPRKRGPSSLAKSWMPAFARMSGRVATPPTPASP